VLNGTSRSTINGSTTNLPSNRTPKIAVISPWPIADAVDPPSGVANYIAAMLLAKPLDEEVHVIAQQGCDQNLATGNVIIHTAWRPGFRAAIVIFQALRTLRPDVVHLQHEFRLFGGIVETMAVLLAIILRPPSRLVTTIHGVVPQSHLTGSLLGTKESWFIRSVARTLLTLNYRLMGAVSDEIIVLHQALQGVLRDDYGLSSKVIPLGAPESTVTSRSHRTTRIPNSVMIFGFLTAYKRPELVLELAEQNLLPDAHYTVSISMNPRIRDQRYQLRYESLRNRAIALPERVTWHDYLSDETLNDLLLRISILVLPYTQLVGATAVGSQALASGIAICHSVALEPIFGAGPTMFELTTTSLQAAIQAVSETPAVGNPALSLPSWATVLATTGDVWKKVGTQ